MVGIIQTFTAQAVAFASGIYFVHIQAGGFAATRKVILIK